MQIKANGISFNCRIDGPEGAPWLILSNSLATNLAMWDEQARNSDGRFGCCAMTSAGTAAARRRPAATPSGCCLPMRWG